MVVRDNEFDRAVATLDETSDLRGVALLGHSGVGKSTMARALAGLVESRGHTVRFVFGTQTGRDIALGAFSRAVSVGAAQEPATMLAAAHTELERSERLVLVVDDAQWLDPLSATLIHQLAVNNTARLILTIRSGEDVPDAITALVKERWLPNIRIEPFVRDQTAELARTVLDGDVDPNVIDELQRRSGGNPLMLRGLLVAGRDSGVLVQTETGWRLHGPLAPDRELQDLLEFLLRSLAPAEREVIEILATAEVLEWQLLRELCDADATEYLEQRGLIQLIADGPHLVAELNHPVIGDVALRLAGNVRSRKLNGVLAEALSNQLQTGGQRTRVADVRGQIRMAQFAMRSDLPLDVDAVVSAAQNAMTLANIDAGADLARFALEHGGGLPAAILLGDALRWQGRSDEAEQVLAEAEPDPDDALLTTRWGCLRAANLFEGCGEVDRAYQILADVRQRVGVGPHTDLVTATEASFAFFSGDVATAIDTGLRVCRADALPVATITAAAPTSWALTYAGRFSEIPAVVQSGLDAVAVGAPGTELLVIGLAEAAGLAASGDLTAAENAVRRYEAASRGPAAAEGLVNAVLGYVRLVEGALTAASVALHRAVIALSAGFLPAGLMLSSSWAAQTYAARGDARAAAAALRAAEQAFGPQAVGFQPDLELARAWVAGGSGHTTAARQHALQAAQLARRGGMYAVEARALHTAVRFGDRSPAARLEELAGMLSAPLPDACALQARGLARRDGDLLDQAADRFVALGAMAMAADAAAQAAAEHARSGNRSRELEAANRAHRFADQTGLRSPATVATASPLPITPREREIAALVAAGLSNRQIAERLGLSTRTVGGHLYRMFSKLDIGTRDQLAQLLDERA